MKPLISCCVNNIGLVWMSIKTTFLQHFRCKTFNLIPGDFYLFIEFRQGAVPSSLLLKVMTFRRRIGQMMHFSRCFAHIQKKKDVMQWKVLHPLSVASTSVFLVKYLYAVYFDDDLCKLSLTALCKCRGSLVACLLRRPILRNTCAGEWMIV